MKIGIDLDDIVFDFVNLVLVKYKEFFGREILFENVSSFCFKEVLGLSQEEVDNFFKKLFSKEIVMNMGLCDFAREMIFELSKDNDIFFITSRVARDGTLESLDKYFSDVDFEVHFSSNPYYGNEGKSKGEICDELGINFMIEDDIKHSEECAKRGIKVFLMDKPWNKECIGHENIIRVKDWKEIQEKLEGNVLEKVKFFVEDECNKHLLGKEIFLNHLIPVANYSKKLAQKKDVDLELIEIASLLHDIGTIKCGRENHHITGAEIAEKKLKEFGYPEEKIELVKKCVLNHRGSKKKVLTTPEEKIIAEADCLTFFDNLEGYFLWVIDGDGIKIQKLIRESVREKVQNKWNQLFPYARELIKSKYDAAMLLFGDGN